MLGLRLTSLNSYITILFHTPVYYESLFYAGWPSLGPRIVKAKVGLTCVFT